MVTHMGEVWLRGKTLLIVVLIGMLSSVSINGLMTLAAQAEAPDAESEQSTTSTPGFTRTEVYRAQAMRDVRYITDAEVTSLRFVARDSNGGETPVAVSDDDPQVGSDGYKVWRLAVNPVSGSKLVAQALSDDDTGEWSDLDGEVALREYPTVTLAPFDVVRTGANLEVKGSVKGVLSDITVGILVQLVPENEGPIIEKEIAAQDQDGLLTTFSLAEVKAGNYTVQFTAYGREWVQKIGGAKVEIAQAPEPVPETSKPDPVTTPVVPTVGLTPLPTLEKNTPKRLSTNFATPLATSRTVSPMQVRASVRQSDADVLGSQTREALEEAIDLRTTASASGLPVEATREGWKIFGHPWYWWLTGTFATIGSGVYLMRRIVRQS